MKLKTSHVSQRDLIASVGDAYVLMLRSSGVLGVLLKPREKGEADEIVKLREFRNARGKSEEKRSSKAGQGRQLYIVLPALLQCTGAAHEAPP